MIDKLSWREKTERRLDHLEIHSRHNAYLIDLIERKLGVMDAALEAKWNAVKDVVKAAESAMDSLKRAADWLRTHGDVAGLADEMDAVTKELGDKVKSVAASGGVAA